MRILELEIKNIRGLTSLNLKPNGKNILIWGPNGSGKSAVVDSIDFLLTGGISRLSGEGTKGITLKKHGTHIDHQPEEAVVRAVIKLNGFSEPIEIKRCMANPYKLVGVSEDDPITSKVLELAKQGLHVLTRRDILKYITADAGTRAKEIQDLLNLTEIELIRQVLVSVTHDCEKSYKSDKLTLEKAKGYILSTTQQTIFDEKSILAVINKNREALGGNQIEQLNSKELKAEIKSPISSPSDKSENISLLKRDIENLNRILSTSSREQIGFAEDKLIGLISSIKSDPKLIRALSCRELIKLGIKLVDETGVCPLCDKDWPQGELLAYLQKKLSDGEFAAGISKNISELSEYLLGLINKTNASIAKMIETTVKIALVEESILFKEWLSALEEASRSLSNDIYNFPDLYYYKNIRLKDMFAPPNIEELLKNILLLASSKWPQATPEQTSWDTLTRLGENLKVLEDSEIAFRGADLALKRSISLHHNFIIARDEVLESLYKQVKENFVLFYRALHGPDENSFDAKLQPKDAGLSFEVDFYGKGSHPPQALHSEGHQDSMGLCLYLALAEKLTKGVIDLIILDDVIMSVDSDHRKEVCSLLKAFFPDRQFLITTHDQTWKQQLKSEGVVDSKAISGFTNWRIDSGPQVMGDIDIWEKIDEYLIKNDMTAAASNLRNGCEEYFGIVCECLKAPVVYKIKQNYELGEFIHAAWRQYKSLLKKAKESANSWNRRDLIETLNETESTADQMYKRTDAEIWAVNTTVHYNNWSTLTPTEFRPIVEAFNDLWNIFRCTSCSSMLSCIQEEKESVSVRCKCGKINWNLAKKISSK